MSNVTRHCVHAAPIQHPRPMRVGLLVFLSAVIVAADLDQHFTDAATDPAVVVPLIEAVSATLPTLSVEEAIALGDRAAPFCRRLFSEALPGRERAGFITHVIAAGDTPSVLARRYRTSVELIQRLNPGLDPRALSIDQPVVVLDLAKVPLELVVSRSAFRLMAWRGTQLVGVFRCGLGRDSSPTPLGTTTIRQCVRNPEWRNPDTGKILKPDDPDNILGGYWIGFEPRADGHFKGIGIHGFTGADPEHWLEKNGSHGCVRLVQDDVALVFALVRPGITVTIRE
jgi:lipoprotein-anchoring transpeptidase ErfK/SrfK